MRSLPSAALGLWLGLLGAAAGGADGPADAGGRVWYVPGWMRTEEAAQAGTAERMRAIFSPAPVDFKAWDGDRLLWPQAVRNADRAADRMAEEVAALPEAERAGLTLVGHSLGGRIVARALARLAARGLKVRQGILLAAAIPSDDADLAAMGGGSERPVLAVCNPGDVTLRYVYAVCGGSAPYGANGSLAALPNVEERVVPADIAQTVPIGAFWGRSAWAKELASHHAWFYLGYLGRIAGGEAPDGRVMVMQDFVTLEARVLDGGVWWETLDECAGWKLERHIVTRHCRILDPGKVRRAWGGERAMRASFAKARRCVEGE